METHFQTSFIPKKPSMPVPGGGLTPLSPRSSHREHHSGTSIFMAIAVILFTISVLSIGGVYVWKQILLGSQASEEQALSDREKSFNLDQISLLKAEAAKIQLAESLVQNHLAVSKIFSVISQLTDENVRFLTMSLTVPVGTQNPFQLVLTGYGKSFPSVAFQSDVLNSLSKYGLQSVVKNAIVSDPTLNHDGTVSFGFTAQVDPSTFLYSKNVTAGSGAPQPAPAQAAPAPSAPAAAPAAASAGASTGSAPSKATASSTSH